MKVENNLLERPEAAEALEVGESYGHLRLVVVILVQVGSRGVKSLGELFVGVSLKGAKGERTGTINRVAVS